MVLLFYKLQSPAFSWWYHSLSHQDLRSMKTGGPPAQSTGVGLRRGGDLSSRAAGVNGHLLQGLSLLCGGLQTAWKAVAERSPLCHYHQADQQQQQRSLTGAAGGPQGGTSTSPAAHRTRPCRICIQKLKASLARDKS